MSNNTTIRSKRKFLDPNTVYHSNSCGDFVFLSEAGYHVDKSGNRTRMVKIKFLQTGYETIVRFSAALNGGVKDPYYPNIFGVGYRGNIASNEYTKEEYDMWFHMLNRVYNTKHYAYDIYGGAGVTVDPRWHSLENFIHDIKQFPEYKQFQRSNKGGWTLDKDMKQMDIPREQRHYGPDTCMLLPKAVNSKVVGLTNLDKASSKYLGVHKLSNGKFQSRIMANGKDIFLGTYDDEDAAANMYNHVNQHLYYGDTNQDIFMNDVPYMDIKECLKHKKQIPINLPKDITIAEIKRYNNDCKKPKSQRTYFKEKSPGIMTPPPPGHQRMYRLTNIPDEERRAECLRKYGIEFL